MPQALNPRDEIVTLDHRPVLIWNAPANALSREADVGDLLSAAWENDVDWVALHTHVLHDDFFRLETGLAGVILQKLVNYRVKLTIIGDIESWLARSEAFRAFVRETNRGNTASFVATFDTFLRRSNT
ncbi:DUF4180 domain-containing protein [Pandoraea norimbergensis]|uniref:DUF4180 domain-containing protein n=1 Tax=Pandoraea norimbergensis TaxID=93219 RepID=UPI000A022D22|nr:DUF4180 domain-containing protein [Pandoraea norimbergensis]